MGAMRLDCYFVLDVSFLPKLRFWFCAKCPGIEYVSTMSISSVGINTLTTHNPVSYAFRVTLLHSITITRQDGSAKMGLELDMMERFPVWGGCQMS